MNAETLKAIESDIDELCVKGFGEIRITIQDGAVKVWHKTEVKKP